MKNTKNCPKCNSNSIIKIPGDVSIYGAGNNIMVGRTIYSAIRVTRYLCCNCGYSEDWIDNKKDIEKLRNKFQDE